MHPHWPGGASPRDRGEPGWQDGRSGRQPTSAGSPPPSPDRSPDDAVPSGSLSAGDAPLPEEGQPATDDENSPEPSWRRWIAPAAMALVALGGGVGAIVLDDHPSAEPYDSGAAATPVLSARRVPELLTSPIAERRLVAELETWATDLPTDSCVVVSDAGSELFSLNPDQPLPGASTQKLVTAAAALLAGDPDDHYQTVAASTATVDNGVLAGDLYVIGGGDPLLGSEDYLNQAIRGAERLHDVGELADAIADAGVTHIQGSVIGDESRYDSDRFHPAWPDRFREQNQAGPISALNVNDGFAQYPDKVPAADPAANAAAVITELLAARGVTVDGPPQSGPAPDGAEQVASLESLPLRDIAAQTLTDSDAETSEMLFKELGLDRQGTGSWESGAEATAEVLTEAGVSLENIDIVDGSGLSHENRLSCSMLVDLLTHPEIGSVVIDGLAVGGETGTLADYWNGTDAEGRVLGKTGTLRNVSALAGQVLPVDGGALTYAYVATVPEPEQLAPAQTDRFLPLGEILVDHSAGVDLAELLPADYPDELAPAEEPEADNADG